MAQVILLNKPLGFTPLQALESLKLQDPTLKNKKLTYAGRLDPMAEGLLLILKSPTQSIKEKFLNLDKTYQFKLLLGASTDTYDLLGQPARTDLAGTTDQANTSTRTDLAGILPQFTGEYLQPYPPYSSKPVNGKPLFYYARTNQLSKINIPTKKIKIKSLKLISSQTISKSKLKRHLLQSIKLVKGDFRQPEIIKSWQKYFSASLQSNFTTYTLEVKCSSGTYIRSLAHRIGLELNYPTLALSIKRTQVGPYLIKNAIRLPK